MTAQCGEALRYQGKDYNMGTEPLEMYFELTGARPDFQPAHTGLWRCYIGGWEIIDDRLYLVEIAASLKEGSEVTLETIFPGFPDRVFAHWFSGVIRIPQGKLLKYVHMGYGSTYERDHLLHLEQGVVVDSELRENAVPEQ